METEAPVQLLAPGNVRALLKRGVVAATGPYEACRHALEILGGAYSIAQVPIGTEPKEESPLWEDLYGEGGDGGRGNVEILASLRAGPEQVALVYRDADSWGVVKTQSDLLLAAALEQWDRNMQVVRLHSAEPGGGFPRPASRALLAVVAGPPPKCGLHWDPAVPAEAPAEIEWGVLNDKRRGPEDPARLGLVAALADMIGEEPVAARPLAWRYLSFLACAGSADPAQDVLGAVPELRWHARVIWEELVARNTRGGGRVKTSIGVAEGYIIAHLYALDRARAAAGFAFPRSRLWELRAA
jgi:hypothetical protein